MERTTVKSMWGWMFDNYELMRSRLDRAIKPNTGQAAQDAPAIEVGYGSYTVRVRVYDGPRMLGFVDFDSRQGASREKLDEVVLLMAQAGFIPVVVK